MDPSSPSSVPITVTPQTIQQAGGSPAAAVVLGIVQARLQVGLGRFELDGVEWTAVPESTWEGWGMSMRSVRQHLTDMTHSGVLMKRHGRYPGTGTIGLAIAMAGERQ